MNVKADDVQRDLRILIVGAGPVGLAAAIELHRRGFSPHVIDRDSGPVGESRALGIHARTLDILEPAGITPKLIAAGNVVNGAEFHDDNGAYARINFTLARQKYNHVLILPQSQTEQILIDALEQRSVHVNWNTSLEKFRVDGDEVECSMVATTTGEATTPRRYDILIGADGAQSQVRETLGIEFVGESYPNDWALADVRFRGTRSTDLLRIKLTQGEVLAYFPLDPSAGRFVLSGPGLMDVIGQEVEVEDVLWKSEFRIRHRIVETYQKGNVFLAGDAAHIHSPLGGRGMNLGIDDAATLAWLIENDQTDRYTEIRKPVGQSVLWLTDFQTQQATSRNPLVRFARRYVPPVLFRSKTAQRFLFSRISGANTPRPGWL